MKKSLKILTSLILFIIVVFGIVYASHPFKIHHQRIIPKRISIVSLGDSLTQGIGDQTHHGGYVPMIANQLSNQGNTKVKTYNYGIAGQKSNQIDRRLVKHANIKSHLKKANIIVITAGGNDLLQTLESSVFDNHHEFNQDFNRNMNAYQHNLIRLLKRVRSNNHHANVYIFGIYNPFYVYFPNVTSINSSVDRWNQTTRNSLKQFKKMYFVDINNLSYGQYQTNSSRKKLMSKNAANGNNLLKLMDLMHSSNGELNQDLSPKDHFHPNDKGYRFMTNKLHDAIKSSQFWY
ncbi:lipase/acylhydrolase [Philodulcilactobacillus myokoensis]|uniref:Lipase/acylhydrolase n=1 Tax=Philodulcilactobacillus myokoensis TaxID=2929573 RepID=A0A9W6B0S7_9LACO|nr:SGNH/GDSL hydrolase family protein [Philodulcilactobacillus myokoensis]GLB46879.1 lipase/acylhydrolase [Philodulcilactobacillus myokoensis]